MIVDLTRHYALVDREERSARAMAAAVERYAAHRREIDARARAIVAQMLAEPVVPASHAVMERTSPVRLSSLL